MATPEDIQRIIQEAQETARTAAASPADTPAVQTAAEPTRDPQLQFYDVERERFQDEARQARQRAMESMAFQPADTPRPEQMAPLSEVMDWDPSQAEQFGLRGLADAMRKRKASPAAYEPGKVEAEDVVEFPMGKSYGRFGTSPDLVEQELTYANLNKMMRRAGVSNFWDLDADERERYRAIARDQAQREVASIIGVQQQRGNVLVDLDPDTTIDKIRRGETLAGFMSGQYVGAKVEGALRGISPEDTVYSKVMSPFTALFVQGGRSVEPQTERPVIGMQKEGKLSWFLRLAPSTAIGSWMFSDEPIEWGGEDHIRKIYAEGYDVTQEVRDFGEAYSRATPWVDSDIAKKVAGYGMVAPIILLEPDATAAVAGPLGAAARVGMKYASPTRLMLNTVLRPELQRWTRTLDDTIDAAGEFDMAAFESRMNLRPWTPRWLMWRAAKGEFFARMVAEEVPLWDVKSSSSIQGILRAAEQAAKRKGRVGEELMEAGEEAQAARRGAIAGDEMAQEAVEAFDQEVGIAEAVESFQELLRRRDAMLGAIAKIAKANGSTLADELAGAGDAGAKAMESLLNDKKRYDEAIERIREIESRYDMGKEYQEASVSMPTPEGRGLAPELRFVGDYDPDEFVPVWVDLGRLDEALPKGERYVESGKNVVEYLQGSAARPAATAMRMQRLGGLKRTVGQTDDAQLALAMRVVADSRQGTGMFQRDAIMRHLGVTKREADDLQTRALAAMDEESVRVIRPGEDLTTMAPGDFIPDFIDGRHRLAALRELGFDRAPMLVDRNVAPMVQQLYGARVPSRVVGPGVARPIDIGITRPGTAVQRARGIWRRVADDVADEYGELVEFASSHRAKIAGLSPEITMGSLGAQFRAINKTADEMVDALEILMGKQVKGGRVGEMLRNAKTSAAMAEALMRREIKQAAVEGKYSEDSLRALSEVTEKYGRAKRAADVSANPGDLMRRILQRYKAGADGLARAIDERAVEVKQWDYSKSVLKEARDSGGLEVEDMLARMTERYGGDAVEQAVLSSPQTKHVLARGGDVIDADLELVGQLERAAWDYLERGRAAEYAPIRAVLESTTEVPRWSGHFTKEGFLASTMKLIRVMERVIDPILSRGLAGSPKLIREVYRRSFERFQSMEMELNTAVRAAVEAGEDGGGIEAAMIYLTNKVPMVDVAGGAMVGNRDTLSLAQKSLNYLKAVAKGGDEAWNSDLAVRALAWSALPTAQAGEMGAGTATKALRKMIDEHTEGEAFLRAVQESMEEVILKEELAIDAAQVTARFISRGAMWGATMHDAMFDLMRAQGGGFSAHTANAMNFLLDARKAKVLGKDFEARAVDEAMQIISAYNLPLTQEVSTGLANSVRTFFGGVRRKNELLRLAEVEGKSVYVPQHINAALQEIPRRLVKELEQFDQPRNPLSNGLHKLLRMWRISVVNGWVFPRPAHFVNTFFGDMSQLVAAVGWRPAMRISAQTAVAYVPFVGARMQDKLSKAAMGRSMISGMFNPQLSVVMNGRTADIIETADGPISARRLLHEAHEDGMLDSISTNDLLEVTRRVPQARWQKYFNGDPPPWIQGSAKFLEKIQHRIRVQTYLEARTGKLTGSPLSRREAANLTREALFDWRLGVPRWEAETVGRLFVFWTYKRAMLRQLGASLTESVTAPGQDYIFKALTGRTKLNRMRQTGQLLSAIPETIYWQPDDELLDDEGQILAYGRRVLPWWVDAQQLLMNRELDGQRRMWYSEVAGRDVTTESLILPTLTTMDAMASMTLMSQTAMASTVMLGEAAGLQPRLTTADAGRIWEANVDAIGESLAPGAGELFVNMARPLLGDDPRRSSRGMPVDQATAVTLNRLGWGEFVGTYEDKSGRMRYHADPNALQYLGRAVAIFPPMKDVTKNWTNAFDNPGYQSSLIEGISEGFLRTMGLVRYAGHTPLETREWEVIGQENRMEQLLKDARAQSGER